MENGKILSRGAGGGVWYPGSGNCAFYGKIGRVVGSIPSKFRLGVAPFNLSQVKEYGMGTLLDICEPHPAGRGFWASGAASMLLALSLSACSKNAVRNLFGGDSVPIPPGCFSMGKAGWEETEPVHRVCLDGFEIDRTEVTLAQYEKCVERKRCNPPEYFPEPGIPPHLRRSPIGYFDLLIPEPYDPEDYWGPESIPGKRNHPVVGITWMDAHQYCRESGKRLPTEAEWEYAMLGGDSIFKDTALVLANSSGWFAENSRKQAHPVGRKSPNGLGLYDMLGNVGEYVQDGYDSRYYASSPVKNPQGPLAGNARGMDANIGIELEASRPYTSHLREMHVVRGGSWSSPFGPYLAYWRWSDAEPRSWWVGFRCARSRVASGN